MKKLFIIFSTLFLLSSCTQRGCQSFERDWEFDERKYEIVVFSGGDTVFYDEFEGIINGEEGTDGIFYINNDTLVEISGDYIVKSVK